MPSFLLFLNGYNDTEKASTHLILAFRNVASTRLKVDRTATCACHICTLLTRSKRCTTKNSRGGHCLIDMYCKVGGRWDVLAWRCGGLDSWEGEKSSAAREVGRIWMTRRECSLLVRHARDVMRLSITICQSNKCGAQELLHQLSFSHHSSGHESPRREAKAGVYEYVARLSVMAIVCVCCNASPGFEDGLHTTVCCMDACMLGTLGTLDWTASNVGSNG